VAHSSKALIQRELLDTIKELRATIEALRKQLEESNNENKALKEQIEVMTRRLFGRSSEKHMTQSEGQIDFFNEVEMEANKTPEEEIPSDIFDEDVAAPAEETQKTRKPRTRRKDLFKGIPVDEMPPIELPEEEQYCDKCGAKMEPAGKKLVREELIFTPAKLRVRRIYVQTYACSECKENGDKNNLKNAPAPEALIPHSYATEPVVAHAMYEKFANALPLYRQEKDWQQMGAALSRGTLGR